MSQDYKHKYLSVFLLNYHFVWIPRRRKPVLKGKIAKRLASLIRERAKELGIEILLLEIQPDHVHLFVSCPPSLSPDQTMFRIKSYTAMVLRKECSELLTLPSMWTRSYFVSTAENVSSETIRKYIEQQSKRA